MHMEIGGRLGNATTIPAMVEPMGKRLMVVALIAAVASGPVLSARPVR